METKTDPQTPPIDLNQELTAGFACRYLRFKARQLCRLREFGASDQSEVEQELRLALFRAFAKFGRKKGTWHGFVVSVVDRMIARLVRRRRRPRRQFLHVVISLSELAIGPDGVPTELANLITPEQQSRINDRAVRDHTEEICRTTDVKEMLSVLPPRLRSIARQLQTFSVTEVARMRGVPRRTLRDRISEIRGLIQRHRAEKLTAAPREKGIVQ